MGMDGGVYIAVFRLDAARRIRVGGLGWVRLRRGTYFYVGSAQKNLTARIERHGRRRKPLRWHIDYLSVWAEMLGAVIVPGPRGRECEIARELADLFEPAVQGFGASDCRCPAHLFLKIGTHPSFPHGRKVHARPGNPETRVRPYFPHVNSSRAPSPV